MNLKTLSLLLLPASLTACASMAPREVILDTPEISVTEQQKVACLRYAKDRYAWKDKESVRIDDAEWGTVNGIKFLQIVLNAKNTYGAYSGGQYAGCFLNGQNQVFSFRYPFY